MGCVDPDRAVTEVRLNASAPFEPDALFLSVTTSLLSAFIIFKALVDSGSMHCFVDPRFIAKNNLITYPITNLSRTSHSVYILCYSTRFLVFNSVGIQLAHPLQSVD